MAAEPFVSVRGTAILEVEPEIARIGVMVSARDRDRQKVLSLMRSRAEQALALIRRFGDAVEAIETGAVRFQTIYQPGGKRGKIDGYLAQIVHTVTVSDFEILGELMRPPHWPQACRPLKSIRPSLNPIEDKLLPACGLSHTVIVHSGSLVRVRPHCGSSGDAGLSLPYNFA